MLLSAAHLIESSSSRNRWQCLKVAESEPELELELVFELEIKFEPMGTDGPRVDCPPRVCECVSVRVCGCLSLEFPLMHFSCVSFVASKWGRYQAIPNNNETPIYVSVVNKLLRVYI